MAGDKNTLLFYGTFSVTTFINCSVLLEFNHKNEFIYGDNKYFIFLSTIHVIMFILWAVHAIRFTRQHKKFLPNQKQRRGKK